MDARAKAILPVSTAFCVTVPRDAVMTRWAAAALIISGLCAAPNWAREETSGQLNQQTLFHAGDGGYACYRIPSLVVTTKGTVIAFAEARKNSRSDHGDIDLVMRRSFNGGRTWSDCQFIADDGVHTMGNPCPVVDRRNGSIWLAFCRDNKRVLMTKSIDDGRTWTRPTDITRAAMDTNWHWVGTGPGHGVQLRSGRLLMPCWADTTPRLGEIQLSFVFWSDDGGATWKQGGVLDANASDECEVVELETGGLYLNARSRQGKKQRAYSFSGDDGETWSTVKYDPRLSEPSCQGSVVRLTDSQHFQKSRMLLSTPADPSSRTRLTIRLSYDECLSWPVSKVLYEGSSAYSDLAVTPDRCILCLYEADDYSRINLARFSIEWLTDGKDSLNRRGIAVEAEPRRDR